MSDMRLPSDPLMELRDWFAGNAIAMGQQMAFRLAEDYKDPAIIAQKAYEVADAMLAERKRTQEGV